MKRWTLLALLAAAGCNQANGDNLIGTHTLKSGRASNQCAHQPAQDVVLDAGEETLTIARIKDEHDALSLVDTNWGSCRFVADATGPSDATVVATTPTCVDPAGSGSSDSIALVGGTLRHLGGHLAVSFQITTVTDGALCSSDATLTF
ncbi:MAG: hypothetical protein ABI321_03790 [Polyangia bacterium]